MKSETLTNKALKKSWSLLTQGQQLADDGKSMDEVLKTFPKETIFQTNNNSILFFIKGSVPMIIEFNKNNSKKWLTKGGSGNNGLKSEIAIPLNFDSNFKNASTINYEGSVDVIASDRNDDERQKKKALIISPYLSYFGKNDDGLIANKYLEKNRNYKDELIFLKDSVSLDVFANLDKYDLVHLSTHGLNYCNTFQVVGVTEENGDITFEESPFKGCKLVIATGIKHGFDNIKEDETQMEKFWEIYHKYKDAIYVSRTEIYLTDNFFYEMYGNGLENKIWIFSACELGQNNLLRFTMNNIHTNGNFLYWQNTVNSSDAYRAFNVFYKNLIVKGLDVKKAFKEIPNHLKTNLKSEVTTYHGIQKDSVEATTQLLHLQTDDPRHGIEIIDMLIPETKEMVVLGDYYPITGDFNDGKDEALTLKVKLIGYTKAEFTEKQMSISLEVDGVSVLNHKPFLPDVEDDEITIEPLKEHKFGIIVTINDISIPDVGDKKELTLKAILHLNDKHVSIHKELVSIVANGITATMKESGMTLKYIYDNKTKAVKVISSDEIMYYDNEGTIYMKDEYGKWMKMKNGGMNMGQLANMPSFIPLTSNDKEEIQNMSSGLPPFIKFAINFRMISFETNNQFEKSLVDCGLPIKCNKFTNSQGMYAIFNTAGKLIEYSFGKGVTIKYKYGDYNVKLPKANLFKMPVINYRAAEQELKKQGINLNFN